MSDLIESIKLLGSLTSGPVPSLNLRAEVDALEVRRGELTAELDSLVKKFAKVYGICRHGNSTFKLEDAVVIAIAPFSSSQYAIEYRDYGSGEVECLIVPIAVIESADPEAAAWLYHRAECERIDNQRRQQEVIDLERRAHKLGFALLPVAKP